MKQMFCANYFDFTVGDYIKLDLSTGKGLYKITKITPQLPHSNIIEVNFASTSIWEKIKFHIKNIIHSS